MLPVQQPGNWKTKPSAWKSKPDVKPHCTDMRATPWSITEAHGLLRQEHDLHGKSREDYEKETRAVWKAKILRECGSKIDSGVHTGADANFNADASFTRWLSPSRNPERIGSRSAGCRNHWQQKDWAQEARARWHSQNPKQRWHTSSKPLPQMSAREIMDSGRGGLHDSFEIDGHRLRRDAFNISTTHASFGLRSGRTHGNIHQAQLW
mmetsp:Transcript_12247/g.23783  ORF Transcript_12247/g.23783 Transcript_12247/m.23783 type:complete len:208 (+) Transcript_12247:77-700(+)